MDRYTRLGPTTTGYKVLYYALDGSVHACQVLVGAALGAAAGVAIAPNSAFRPLRAVVLAAVASAIAIVLAPRMRKALARVVTPVDLHVRWWNPVRVLGWGAVTLAQGLAIELARWPRWPVRWWAVAAAAGLLLAWRTRQMNQQLARWRGSSSMGRPFRRARRIRSAQLAIAWLAMFASTVPGAAWAAGGHGLSTLVAWCGSTLLALALVPLFGPIDLARAVSDSPVPVLDQGWLRWYGSSLPPTWLISCLAGLGAGIYAWSAAAWMAAVAVGLAAAILVGMLILAVTQSLMAEDIAQSIADGARYANHRFALYLRPFSVDGALPMPPWIGRREAHRPPPAPENHDLPMEIESALTSALAPVGIPLFAIGGEPSQNLIQIEREDGEWYRTFCGLSQRALFLVFVLGTSPGVTAELEFLRRRGLLDKTLFLVPPWRSQPALEQLWRQAKEPAGRLGLELPEGDPDGAIFALTSDGRLRENLPMEDTTAQGFRWAMLHLLHTAADPCAALAGLRRVVTGASSPR